VWIDDDGHLHTVALPDPTDVMTEDFQAGLDLVIGTHRDELRALVQLAEERVAKSDWSELDSSENQAGEPPPTNLLRGAVTTPADVARAVDDVNLRWRLDTIMALGDYVE
jgi:hypothetical protein